MPKIQKRLVITATTISLLGCASVLAEPAVNMAKVTAVLMENMHTARAQLMEDATTYLAGSPINPMGRMRT